MNRTLSPLYAARLALRLALGASFLSAVADRFGLWGLPGAPRVAWGDFAHFLAYTEKLTHVAPALFGWSATIAETALGLALVGGIRVRLVATLSGGLLATFALAMVVALGLKAPLDYSVFTAAAAAFLLGSLPADRDAIERWRSSRSATK